MANPSTSPLELTEAHLFERVRSAFDQAEHIFTTLSNAKVKARNQEEPPNWESNRFDLDEREEAHLELLRLRSDMRIGELNGALMVRATKVNQALGKRLNFLTFALVFVGVVQIGIALWGASGANEQVRSIPSLPAAATAPETTDP